MRPPLSSRGAAALSLVLPLALLAGCGAAPAATSFDMGGRRGDVGAGSDGGLGDGGDAGAPATDGGGVLAVHVAANHLVDGAGKTLRLLGVDDSGGEYACVGGGAGGAAWGVFDEPSDDGEAAAIASWHADVVRVPMNEDCWLGINGVDPTYSGAAYQTAFEKWVATLHRHGLYVILDLHWSAPGTTVPHGQWPMADQDHGPAFWSSVAGAFKDDPAVLFDLFNEPYLNQCGVDTMGVDPWVCWQSGCTISYKGTWQTAGMQELVDAVRGAGATQPILLGGLAYSNDLTGWLAHEPTDPLGQLAAAWHVYDFNTCMDASCWTSQGLPVAAKVPLVTGEFGSGQCANTTFMDSYMSFADANGLDYLAWTWNPWGCPNALTSNAETGAPTAVPGTDYRAHLMTERP